MVYTSETKVPAVRPGAQPSVLPAKSWRFWVLVAQCSHSGERPRQETPTSRATTPTDCPTWAEKATGGRFPAMPLVSLRTLTPLTMICRSSSTEIAVVRSGPPEMIQEVQVAGCGVPVGQAPLVAPGKLANFCLGMVRVTPLTQIVSFLPLPAARTVPCAWLL